MKYYLGMDIGGTKCSVVLSEKNSNKIKAKIRFDTRVERGHEEIIGQLISSAASLMSENGVSKEDVICWAYPVEGLLTGRGA